MLAAQVDERHRAHGDVAFLLEPDLKEAHGGLRDFHAVRSAALGRCRPSAEQVDLASLSAPLATLTAARVELHRVTDRATDRLLLQEQDQVAGALRYRDADALMAAIAEAGRTIAWVTDDVWRRRSTWPVARPRAGAGGRSADPLPGRAPTPSPSRRSRPVSPCAARRAGSGGSEGEVVLDPATDPGTDPTLALRVAAVAAEHGLPIGRSTLDALAAAKTCTPRTPGRRDAGCAGPGARHGRGRHSGARGPGPAGIARPARPGMGSGAQPAPAQRLSPLHR